MTPELEALERLKRSAKERKRYFGYRVTTVRAFLWQCERDHEQADRALAEIEDEIVKLKEGAK